MKFETKQKIVNSMHNAYIIPAGVLCAAAGVVTAPLWMALLYVSIKDEMTLKQFFKRCPQVIPGVFNVITEERFEKNKKALNAAKDKDSESQRIATKNQADEIAARNRAKRCAFQTSSAQMRKTGAESVMKRIEISREITDSDNKPLAAFPLNDKNYVVYLDKTLRLAVSNATSDEIIVTASASQNDYNTPTVSITLEEYQARLIVAQLREKYIDICMAEMAKKISNFTAAVDIQTNNLMQATRQK